MKTSHPRNCLLLFFRDSPTSRGFVMKTAFGATPNMSWWCQASGTSSPSGTPTCMFMVATGTAPLRIQRASQGTSLTFLGGWKWKNLPLTLPPLACCAPVISCSCVAPVGEPQTLQFLPSARREPGTLLTSFAARQQVVGQRRLVPPQTGLNAAVSLLRSHVQTEGPQDVHHSRGPTDGGPDLQCLLLHSLLDGPQHGCSSFFLFLLFTLHLTLTGQRNVFRTNTKLRFNIYSSIESNLGSDSLKLSVSVHSSLKKTEDLPLFCPKRGDSVRIQLEAAVRMLRQHVVVFCCFLSMQRKRHDAGIAPLLATTGSFKKCITKDNFLILYKKEEKNSIFFILLTSV